MAAGPERTHTEERAATRASPASQALPRKASAEHPILGLQRAVGNQATSDLLEDERERETSTSPGAEPPPVVYDVLSRPGAPLDTSVRALMESRFGADFGAVRIHNDARAQQSAAAVGARAYTVGRDIVFGAPGFNANDPGSVGTLGHELAHTVQNRGFAWQGERLELDSPHTEEEREAASVGATVSRELEREPDETQATPVPDPARSRSGQIQRQAAPGTAAGVRPAVGATDQLDAAHLRVVFGFQDILQLRLAELDALGTEVEKPVTHEPSFSEAIMLAVVKTAIGEVTGAIAEAIAKKLMLSIETAHIEDELEKTFASTVNKSVTKGIEESISKGAEEASEAVRRASAKEKAPSSGSIFIETQKKALIAQSLTVRNNVIGLLPEFRQLERRRVGAGLAALGRFAEAVDAEKQELETGRPQFKRSLSAWLNYLAAATVGEYKPATAGERPGTALGGEALTRDVPGVIKVSVIFRDPSEAVVVTHVTVAGLPEKLREELEDRPIASLGVSVVLESVFGTELWSIGRNESGTLFLLAPPYDRDRFIRYLSAKAGRGAQPSEEAAFAGARLIIEKEVGPHEIKKAMDPRDVLWGRVPPEMTSWPPSSLRRPGP